MEREDWMADLRFDLTEFERAFSLGASGPDELRSALAEVRPQRLDLLIRAYTRNRIPAAFSEKPMVWEATRTWLARKVSARRAELHAYEIGVTGSGNLGFSAVARKFGRPFGAHSDLDLLIVNEQLFERVQLEIQRFLANDSGRYAPQQTTIKHQVARGFADLKQIPADWNNYPESAALLNDCWILQQKLTAESLEFKKVSVRVYGSWRSLGSQLSRTFWRLRSDLSLLAGK